MHNVTFAENIQKNKWWRVLWNQNKFLCYLKQSTWTIYTWAYPRRKMINGKMLTKITVSGLKSFRWNIFFKMRIKDFSCTVTRCVHQLINLRTWAHAPFQTYHSGLPFWQAAGTVPAVLLKKLSAATGISDHGGTS